MKIGLRIFSLLSVTLIFSGCGGYYSKKYDGPELDKSQISIITTDDQFIGIGGLDGNKTVDITNSSDLFNGLIWGGDIREQ